AAIEALKTNPFLRSQHNEQALYHYYLGVSQMVSKRGWPAFKQAEKSMNLAAAELRRSFSPDYGFFSDLENARGYLSITARGLSTDEEKDLVCIIRTEFIYMAINHFREALIYNPDNEIAQGNLDTLLAKLREADIPIPPNPYQQNFLLNSSISLDSVNIDSINDVSLIPILDYSLLPKNYQVILSELHAYDEIVLVMDLSGSMDDPVGWSAEASKFKVAQQLALYITLNLRANVFLGAISVGQQCDRTSMVMHYPVASVSRQELSIQVDAIRPYGHTPLNQRLLMTKEMFSSRQNRKLVFLLSDGMDTCGEIPDLCGTAAILASHGIDLSVFSFIYESLDEESRSAYSIYNCMVNPSEGKIYKITEDGGVRDKIDYIPVSNNILTLPVMDTSYLWKNNQGLYQFDIEGVEPPIERIMKLED
ncbi:MAG: VWA domain-containing protein, partial [Saprospiraceae bacterium]|nr:VWA domain-containing protein [Saprospiraceae bacterium]